MSKPRVYGYHPYENGIPAKGHSMTYLIVGPDGGVLVDPGRGTYHEEVIAFVQDHGLETNDIPWALLTHCHVDHTGGARRMQSEGIRVAASAFTAKAVREASVDMGFRKEPNPHVACEVDRLLHDGETIEATGMKISTIATPGHTAGCLSVLVETDQGLTAFTGDLIRNTGQPGWTGSPSFSLEDSVRSIGKLLAQKPEKAYWGHGEVEGPAESWLGHSLELYRNGQWVMD
jgi:hydroxyacylglutathione hydrolase